MDLRIIFVGFFVILFSFVKSEKAKERYVNQFIKHKNKSYKKILFNRTSRVRIKLHIPKVVKKHTHTRIVTQHHFHKAPNSNPVLPAGEVDSESAGSWNVNSNSKPWNAQSNNDWNLMQTALNPANMDFQQFQNLKNKLKKSNFNLEDYENMKESLKTGDFLKPRPEIKMSMDDMFNRFEAVQKMKQDQNDEETNLYALHKLAKLNAEFLENERQKEKMGN